MWRYIHTYMICTACTHTTLEEKNDINFIFVFHFFKVFILTYTIKGFLVHCSFSHSILHSGIFILSNLLWPSDFHLEPVLRILIT